MDALSGTTRFPMITCSARCIHIWPRFQRNGRLIQIAINATRPTRAPQIPLRNHPRAWFPRQQFAVLRNLLTGLPRCRAGSRGQLARGSAAVDVARRSARALAQLAAGKSRVMRRCLQSTLRLAGPFPAVKLRYGVSSLIPIDSTASGPRTIAPPVLSLITLARVFSFQLISAFRPYPCRDDKSVTVFILQYRPDSRYSPPDRPRYAPPGAIACFPGPLSPRRLDNIAIPLRGMLQIFRSTGKIFIAQPRHRRPSVYRIASDHMNTDSSGGCSIRTVCGRAPNCAVFPSGDWGKGSRRIRDFLKADRR